MKSISSPHWVHLWTFSNSSEKISLVALHLGHLQVKDFSSLKFSNPGQCWGVLMTISFCLNCFGLNLKHVIRSNVLV